MKLISSIIAFALGTLTASAEFKVWTNRDGRQAELELIRVIESDGEKAGEFRLRNGHKVVLKASELDDVSAAWLDENPGAAETETPATESAFADLLDGNLVKLDGRRLKRAEDVRPKKYYLFYYTASWCGPCQRFTPSLVDFYNEHKPSDDFEVILISSDNNEDAMEKYAQDKKMPWPQLKLSRTKKFKETTRHGGRGIPSLVLTDPEGNILKHSYVDGKYVGPTSVMNELKTLLAK